MKIAIIDDHPIVCQGIAAILASEEDIDLVGCVSGGKEAESKLIDLEPDVILVDLRFPGESGLDVIQKLKPMLPNSRFVVFSTYSTTEEVIRAVEAGVDGYLLKEMLPEELISALKLIAKGRPYIHPSVMQTIVQWQKKTAGPLSLLTPREREVLDLLSKGLNNRQIGQRLYISEHTVKKHVSSILAKLDLDGRTQAALYTLSTE